MRCSLITPDPAGTIVRSQPGIVQHLRGIRDQLSREIKDMTFAQERAYLDQLLAEAAANKQQALGKLK